MLSLEIGLSPFSDGIDQRSTASPHSQAAILEICRKMIFPLLAAIFVILLRAAADLVRRRARPLSQLRMRLAHETPASGKK
jgi:hypothetical protein